jgi:Ca2+-binding EF-hand superfamily protein
MADTLPADLVVLYQEGFTHFDTDNDGIITTKCLGELLRFCGENPSEAEVQVTA